MGEIRHEIRRRHFAKPGGLFRFLIYFWPVLEPNTKFIDGWAIQAICEHLEAVSAGNIKRLLINVPPGFAKSLIVNVFWPCWEWSTIGAHLRYVSFSYAAHLTARDNEKFRDLMLSSRYQEMYGKQFQLVKIGSEKVQSNKTGWKFASSIGGVGTGERGNRILLDDPHNVKEAESETVRENTVQWFEESMQNRLNSLKNDAIIVIMQRVHFGDVSQCILDSYPEYDHLCIPMEYDARDVLVDGSKYKTRIGWSDPRNEMGDLAWPEQYPEDVLRSYKSKAYVWAGQYMQTPEARGGGIIKRDQWRMWDRKAQSANDIKIGTYPPFEYVLASFDGAFGQKLENDFSALTVWGTWVETNEDQRINEHFGRPSVMLIAGWRKKLPLHGMSEALTIMKGETKEEFETRKQESWGLVEWIAHTCKRFKVDKLLVEAKANGHDVAKEMQRLHARESWMVVLDDPGKLDKVARAYAVQHLFADGRIWRPDTEWALLVEDELAQLPRGAHDDLADTATMALRHLRRMNLLVRTDESTAAVEELLFPSKPKRQVLHYGS